MKNLIALFSLLALLTIHSFSFAVKKGISKRTWLVYSPLSVNGTLNKDEVKEEPIVTLTFKKDGSLVEDIAGKVGDRMKLPGKWSWNKKPETANGKRCINISFDKMSNISPSKKVYAAIDVDFEIITVDYNFEGHDQPYTGHTTWNARVTLNEMIGDWKMAFNELSEEMPDQNFYLTFKDRDNYTVSSDNEEYKEEGTWSFKNNFITFKPSDETGFMKGMFIEPAYLNAKSRNTRILLNSGVYSPCYLNEVITNDHIIGKWNFGELQIEFTKTFRFKATNLEAFDKFVEKKTPFLISSWELKDNWISFYPEDRSKCEPCWASVKINLYNDGRELTFGDMDSESSIWKKQM